MEKNRECRNIFVKFGNMMKGIYINTSILDFFLESFENI